MWCGWRSNPSSISAAPDRNRPGPPLVASGMTDLARLPHALDPEAHTCRAVIETPMGSRAKYDFNPEIMAFETKGLLPEGMSFPMDFGFVPSTLAEDGDPLDVLVLFDEPIAMGSTIMVRLIGVIEADQTEETTLRNDRLIAVATQSRLYSHVQTVADLGKPYVENLKAFWVHYNALKGQTFDIRRVAGPDAAVRAIVRTERL